MTQQSPYEDIDPIETQEWLESIESVMRAQGRNERTFARKLVDFTRRSGAYSAFKPNTAYLATISKAQEPDYPATALWSGATRLIYAGMRSPWWCRRTG
jgi:pyruvate dehydrogenase E1 component